MLLAAMVQPAARLLARPLLSKAAATTAGGPRPGLAAAFSSSRLAAKIQGEELLGEPLDIDKAFPHEEHKHVEEPVVVNLEAEHSRVEDPEVPMLSSLYESHAPPSQALSAEEAAAEVERLRQMAPPTQESF